MSHSYPSLRSISSVLAAASVVALSVACGSSTSDGGTTAADAAAPRDAAPTDGAIADAAAADGDAGGQCHLLEDAGTVWGGGATTCNGTAHVSCDRAVTIPADCASICPAGSTFSSCSMAAGNIIECHYGCA
jgi:hypothetical protein